MALDEQVSDLLKMEGMIGARHGASLTNAADRNLTQGLAVVNTTLIQQHGGVADDAAQMAALKVADRTPVPSTTP